MGDGRACARRCSEPSEGDGRASGKPEQVEAKRPPTARCRGRWRLWGAQWWDQFSFFVWGRLFFDVRATSEERPFCLSERFSPNCPPRVFLHSHAEVASWIVVHDTVAALSPFYHSEGCPRCPYPKSSGFHPTARTRRCTVNCRGSGRFRCFLLGHKFSVLLVGFRPRQCRELGRSA